MSIESVRSMMAAKGLDACLVADNANMFYIARRIFRGYIYITAEAAEPIFFIIRPLGLEGGAWNYIRKPEQIPDVLRAAGIRMPQTLGLELDDITYSQVRRLMTIFSGIRVENCSPMLREARMVKDAAELELMRACGRRHAAVYQRIPGLYRSGMTDVELQIEIERVLRQEGCLGYLRTSGNMMELNMGSVLSGDNADVPAPYDFAVGGAGVDPSLPVGADGRVMKDGATVMIDMNGNFNGYQSDMTRTWAVGSVSAEVRTIHNLSVEICHKLEKMALPGVPVAALYDEAAEMARQRGLDHMFMGHRQQAAFIGHGVGIQLNEWPVIMHKSPHILQENMTLAIEPKFVIPSVGAVGIENTYIVTPGGLENITVADEEIRVLG